MITKKEVRKLAEHKWIFLIYFNNEIYANFISKSYRTRKQCQKRLEDFLLDSFDFDIY